MDTPTLPTVGQPATLAYPQDRYPYVIIAVSATGYKLTLQELDTHGLPPTGQCNGYPVFDHTYSAAELADPARRLLPGLTAYRDRNGRYFVGGTTPLWLGEARYFRNFAD